MTQIMLVDAMPNVSAGTAGGTFSPGAGSLLPAQFALALRQALTATPEGSSLLDVFQLPQGEGQEGAVTPAQYVVAFENLAAGTIPQEVLDAIAMKGVPAGKPAGGATEVSSEEAGSEADRVSGLLEYLAALIAPVLAKMPLPQEAGSGEVVLDSPPAVNVVAPDASSGGPGVLAAHAFPVGPVAPESPAPGGAAGDLAPTADPSVLRQVVENLGAKFESVIAQAARDSAAGRSAPSELQARSETTGSIDGTTEDAPVNPGSSTEGAQRRVDVDVTPVRTQAAPPVEGHIVVEAAQSEEPAEEARVTEASQRPPLQSAAGVAVATVETTAGETVAASDQTVIARVARSNASKGLEAESGENAQAVSSDSQAKAPEAGLSRPQGAAGADQERLIARISNAITQAERSGRSTVRIRLYPPELGTVRIEVSSVRGSVTARIEVSTPATHGALQSNMAALRADLRQAGIDVRDMQVEYRDPSLAFGAHDRPARRDGGEGQPRQAKRQQLTESPELIEPGGYAEGLRSRGLNVLL